MTRIQLQGLPTTPEGGSDYKKAGSEEGTEVTEYSPMTTTPNNNSSIEFSVAPNNSDNQFDSSSADFVLPEIEEDECSHDDQSNMSMLSRMSATFIQFAPSIEFAGDIAASGLHTVDAANKPNHIACVNTVNFLAEPEPQITRAPPPIQIKIDSNKFKAQRKNKDLVKRYVDAQKPQEDDDDDDVSFLSNPSTIQSAPSSVRSAPSSMASMALRRTTNNTFGPRRAPNGALGGIPRSGLRQPGPLAPPSRSMSLGHHMSAPTRGVPIPPNSMAMPTMVNSMDRIGMDIAGLNLSHRNKLQNGEDFGESASLSSAKSGRSSKSAVSSMSRNVRVPSRSAAVAGIPTANSDGQRETNKHELPRAASSTSHSSKPTKDKKKSGKGSVFNKLFSNHIQADFEGGGILEGEHEDQSMSSNGNQSSSSRSSKKIVAQEEPQLVPRHKSGRCVVSDQSHTAAMHKSFGDLNTGDTKMGRMKSLFKRK